MSKGTTRRSVRVEDDLWEKAQDKAKECDENLSLVIRDALDAYANETEQTLAAAWDAGYVIGYGSAHGLDNHRNNPYRSQA